MEETQSDIDISENESELKVKKTGNFVEQLNEEFFQMANRTIHNLVEENQMVIAGEVKKYVTFLSALVEEYAKEVNEKNVLKSKSEEADLKLRLSLKLTNDSQLALSELKNALENAWRDADSRENKIQDFQDQLQEMIVKCEKFSKKQDTNAEEDDSAQLGSLAKYKPLILRERDRLNGEVTELSRRIQMQRLYIESLEKVWKNSEESNEKSNRRLETIEIERMALEKRLRMAKDDFEELKEAHKNLTLKSDLMTKQLSDQSSMLHDRNKEIDKFKSTVEKNKTQMSFMTKHIHKLKSTVNHLQRQRKVLQEQYKSLHNMFKDKCSAYLALSKKMKKLESDITNQSSKLAKSDKQMAMLRDDVNKLKGANNLLERSLVDNTVKYNNMKKLKEAVTHERDVLRSDNTKNNNQITDLRHTVLLKNKTIDSLQLDIKKGLAKLEDAKNEIARVEKERDEKMEEVYSLGDKIDNYQEQLEIKSENIQNLNIKLNQKHAAYIKVQKQLETTNSERVVLQRSFQTCSEERTKLKTLLNKSRMEETQLTEKITESQNKINSLNLQIERIRAEKLEVETELRNTKNTLKSTRDELKALKVTNEDLHKTIEDDEKRFLKLSIQLEDLRKEKNLIGLQMVRRNDEIIVLKEKVSILQTSLDTGQTEYNQRMEDIKLLKVEITNLQTQRDVLKRGIESTADMREEIIRLQRISNQEKVRTRMLTEDLKTPANVHRWRILKGEDPERMSLIQKIQMLQKRILGQNSEILKHEKKLQESHQLYLSLKAYVAKLPSYKVKENAVKRLRITRNKDKQLKAVIAEMRNMEKDSKAKDCEISELKITVSSLQNDLKNERKIFSGIKSKVVNDNSGKGDAPIILFEQDIEQTKSEQIISTPTPCPCSNRS